MSIRTVPDGRPRRQGGSPVKVVVTGPFGAGKTTLIRTISEITVLSTEREVSDGTRLRKQATTVAMDYGRITIDRDLVLYLFGTPGQERFDFMWEVLGEGMIGYLLLVDASRPQSLDEAVPIVGAFRTMADVPMVVGVTRMPEPTAPLAPEVVRDVHERLALPPSTPVLAVDAHDRESVKQVLLALLYAVLERLDAPAVPAAPATHEVGA